MRRNTLKIALLAAIATIATATPTLANTTTTPPDPDTQSTQFTYASDDNATTDGIGRPGGINSVGDDANPDGLGKPGGIRFGRRRREPRRIDHLDLSGPAGRS